MGTDHRPTSDRPTGDRPTGDQAIDFGPAGRGLDPTHLPSVGTVLRARAAELVRFHPREVAVLAALALLLLAGAGLAFAHAKPAATIDVLASPEAAVPSASPEPRIVVHVVGAVRHPGVYRFDQGARVVDAVRAAGGFTRNAQRSGVNLARVLVDGEQIVVPRRGATAAAIPGAAAPAGAPGGAVNINLAGATELETLPGIGPVLAQRIVDYRDQHGPFRSTRDLLKVSGIGEKTFASLEPLVTV